MSNFSNVSRLKALSLYTLEYKRLQRDSIYTVFQKSDAKIQITITTAYLIRIKYPLSGFNYLFTDVNVANFNKIQRTVSEQQLF